MAVIEVNQVTGNPAGPIYDTYTTGIPAAGAGDTVMETGGFTYNEGGMAIPAAGVTVTSLDTMPNYPIITKNIGTLIDVGNNADTTIERTSFIPTDNAGVQRVITAGPGADRCIVQDCDFENTVAQIGTAFYVSGAVATEINLRRLTFTNLLYGIEAFTSPTQVMVNQIVSRDVLNFYLSNGSGFVLNRVDHEGGALVSSALPGNVFLWLNTDLVPMITNCRAYGDPGAGNPMIGMALDNANDDAMVAFNTIVNDGPGNGDAVKGSWVGGPPENPVVKDNILWGFTNACNMPASATIDYNQTNCAFVGGCAAGPDNDTANPSFASATDHSLNQNSPCIDTGTNVGITEDGRGIVRPQGQGYDRGWYEFYNELYQKQTVTFTTFYGLDGGQSHV